MERPESRSSGLPRVSRLPQGRPGLTARDLETGDGVTKAMPGLARHARSNTTEMRQPTNTRASALPSAMVPASNRQSMLVRPGFQTSSFKEPPAAEDHRSVGSPTSPMSPNSYTSDDTSVSGSDSRFGAPPSTAPRQTRKSRPSLSDRTMETLAGIPPSPSPRRMSAFYANPGESPMRPPSRTGSSLGYNRPGSRIGAVSGLRQPDRPISPVRKPASTGTGLARPGSVALPRSNTTSSTGRPAGSGLQAPSKLQTKIGGGRGMPPGKTGLQAPGSKVLGRGSAIKSPLKPPAKDVFGGPLHPSSPSKGKSISSTTMPPPRKLTGPKVSSRPAHKPSASLDNSRASSPEKKQTGSKGLRDAIAQAKAVHRTKPTGAYVPRSAAEDFLSDIGPDSDPNQLDMIDSVHFNILKKRIHNARTDGKLNISALCLTEIPSDVLRMFDFDPDDNSSTPWYDTVDVTRLIAGDNEIKELPLELFPSAHPDQANDEEDIKPGPFPNLEHLDFHGNLLQSLPDTIGNMPSLQSLDLTGNKLSNSAVWAVIFLIRTIKDIKLGKNQLKGPIPDEISILSDLELFDAHDNQLEEVTSSLGKLAKMKEINLSGNRLEALPFEPIFDIGISRINLARNKLYGSLFPTTVPSFDALVHLDVSHNSLTYLAEGGINLPNLKSLNVSNNRIIELPAMTTWANIETLLAEENKISAFPEGFTNCTTLRTVNLDNNSLLALEDEIGNMDKLAQLTISNNPLRERKLMRLNTEELKAELRSRRAAEANMSSPRRFNSVDGMPTFLTGSGMSGIGTNATSTPWNVSNGTVDRSNTRMISLDETTVQVVADKDVTSLVLHHNQLQSIPAAIELLGVSLATLDLANNRLGRSERWLASQLVLPNLTTLNLTSNALTSLEPLTANLSAPRLATLMLPFNRLTELPSGLGTAFPALRKLMANNNKISVLDVRAVRGLEVLDLSSNDLEALPPELGLLQGQLRMLMVGGNKFRVPGWGIIEKGTEALLGWCRKQLPEDASVNDGDGQGASSKPNARTNDDEGLDETF